MDACLQEVTYTRNTFIYSTFARIIFQKFPKRSLEDCLYFFNSFGRRMESNNATKERLNSLTRFTVALVVMQSWCKRLQTTFLCHNMHMQAWKHPLMHACACQDGKIKRSHSNKVRFSEHILRILPLESTQKLSWGLACSSLYTCFSLFSPTSMYAAPPHISSSFLFPHIQ